MQTTTQEPAPPLPPVSISITGQDGKSQTIVVPRTGAEVEALLSRREQLSDQLSSASARRQELSEQLVSAPGGASRTGLEQRISQLDQRILQLESEIAKTGEQLATAPGDLVSFTQERRVGNGGDDEFSQGMAAGTIPLLLVVGIVYLWRRRRAKRMGTAKPAQIVESNSRLERLEQGMEAIAIEIERISEGQRFVTKLLAESHGERVIK
jgi:chaperonin cofactor prefoldin